MYKKLVLTFLIVVMVLIIVAGSCNGANDRLTVFVSILPQKYFIEKIGGDLLDVAVMLQPGANPHIYEPKPNQMVALSGSSAYFAIGVNFERVWLEKIADMNPKMRIVHTDDGIRKIPMPSYRHREGAEGEKKAAGPPDNERYNDDHKHHRFSFESHPSQHAETVHGMMDPHIWTSPPLARIQAKNILQALTEIDPRHRADYLANFNRFINEIDDIDREFRDLFRGKEGLGFMVFHPAWGYFAEAYGLMQVPVEIEGKEPKPAQLEYLIQYAKAHGIRVVFVQPQLSSKSARTIAKAIGGKVVSADPLAYDWLNNLKKQAKAFKSALR